MAKKKNPQDASVTQVKRMIAKAVADLRAEFTATLDRRCPEAEPSNVTTLPTQPVVRGAEGSEE